MKKIKVLLPIVVILFTLGGCKKYLDINSDPANPQKVTAELVIAPIIYQMANDCAQDYRQLFDVVQYWGGSAASIIWERHGYSDASDVGGYIWRMTYADHGRNLVDMIADATVNQKYEYAAIGYAIKAWSFQMCTDMHGPIILDEAFNQDLVSYPYQEQDEVYERVRNWCDSALYYMTLKSPLDQISKLNSISGDNIYRGKMELWKKFVYGLKALQYSHLINKSQFASSYADSVIKYTDLSFSDDSEDPTIFFNNANSSDSNPYGPKFGYVGSTSYAYVGKPIVDLLTGGVRGIPQDEAKTSVDPRLTRMLPYSILDSVYHGVVATHGNENSNVPKVYQTSTTNLVGGKYLFADGARWPVMSFSQLQFAKSEAYYYKGNADSAYKSYLEGIRAHMNFINLYGLSVKDVSPITEVEITAYMQSGEVVQNAGDLGIADIMQQKYIAQFAWAGMEQWCDLRKYHYDQDVFKTYHQLTGTELSDQNHGLYAYRYRPRYNSEYMWNVPELEKWGATNTDYMTYETWFSKSGN